MTEGRANRARWTAALVVAPAAAAMFGATTSWAVHARPAAVATAKTTDAPAVPVSEYSPSKDVVAIQASLATDEDQLAAMRETVAQLREQLKNLTTAASPAPAQRSPAPAGAATARGAASGSSGVAGRTPAPRVQAAPAPAAAPPAAARPPVQAVTGASGAPK